MIGVHCQNRSYCDNKVAQDSDTMIKSNRSKENQQQVRGPVYEVLKNSKALGIQSILYFNASQ